MEQVAQFNLGDVVANVFVVSEVGGIDVCWAGGCFCVWLFDWLVCV